MNTKIGLTKYQLAVLLGCTPTQITNYLTGVTKKAGIEVVYRIYDIYGIIVIPYTSPKEIETAYKAKYETL